MPRRQNLQLKRPKDQALAQRREHVLLALSADEEDPKPDRKLRSKVGEGVSLAKTSEEDAEQEDVAVEEPRTSKYIRNAEPHGRSVLQLRSIRTLCWTVS